PHAATHTLSLHDALPISWRGRYAFRSPPPLFAPAAAAGTHALTQRLNFNPQNPRHTQKENEMEVILLERVAKLGQMGEVVRVKEDRKRHTSELQSPCNLV